MTQTPPPAETPGAARLVALVCLAEVLCMTGFAAFAAFLPALRIEWGMSAAEAGFVSGAFFFGYMIAVPLLSGITDRIDARSVFVVACGLSIAGTTGFALFAHGMLSGALCQAIAGAGLAGTYMPGLKAMTDRVEGPRQARFIAFYTASFGIGTSLSLLGAGKLGMLLSWQDAFLALAAGPALAAPLFWLSLSRKNPAGVAHAALLPRFGAVLRHAESRRYILGYVVHCWELFGVRSWLVAFFVFVFGQAGYGAPLTATVAAAIVNLFGIPASILGNEAAVMLGRRRWIGGVMVASGLLCWLIGFAAAWPFAVMLALICVYFTSVMLDSAALTAGLVQATPAEQRGAAMAIYSLLGFGAAFVAPLGFGATLDWAGGSDRIEAWALAFGLLGLGGLAWAVRNGRFRSDATRPS